MIRLLNLCVAFFTLGCGGGSGSSGVSGKLYSPTGLGLADTTWQQLLQQELGAISGPGSPGALIGQTLDPAYQWTNSVFSQLGPLVAAGQPDVTQAWLNSANQANALSNLMGNAAGQAFSAVGPLETAGNQVWQTGLDPQQALYHQLLQQTQDQSRASTSMRGIGTSGESAGIENQAVNQFNIDWQNAQLQRQLEGLGGMTSAYGGALKDIIGGTGASTQAAQMGQQVPNLITQEYLNPLQTDLGLFGMGTQNAQNYLNTYLSSQLGPLASIMGQTLPYMNFGTGAQANAFNAGQVNLGNELGLGSAALGAAGGLGGLNSLVAGLTGGSGIFSWLPMLFPDAFAIGGLV